MESARWKMLPFKMFDKYSNTLRSVLFILVLLVPRQLGLLAVRSNVKARQMSRSQFWLVYSILCGCIFSITYPLAIHSILTNNKLLSENQNHFVIEMVNHVTMYLFSVTIYIRITISHVKHINYNNLAFKTSDECKAFCRDNRENAFILPFVIRVIYSYSGYITLNVITLTQISENLRTLSILNIFIYCIPDLIMTSTMIRVGTAISLQILSCQRINKAFTECMNVAKKSLTKSPVERSKLNFCAMHKFNKITEYHTKIYDLTQETKDLTSSLVISSVLKTFVNVLLLVRNQFIRFLGHGDKIIY